MNPASQLNKALAGAGKGLDMQNPDSYIRIHHELMKEYGWIPIDEFRLLPIPVLMLMIENVSKDREQQRKEYEKAKRKH
jgi:hypothetical protein